MTLRPALFVVVAPLGAMVVWLLSLVVAVSLAQEVRLPVKGYDPRDPLSGHYLRYQVNYGMTFSSQSHTSLIREPSCVCLSQGADGVAKATWNGECSQRDAATCPLFIRGMRTWNVFDAGIERYYIPEEYQEKLARIPENASIKVRVTKSGVAYVTDMYVDGKPILEWAKAQP